MTDKQLGQLSLAERDRRALWHPFTQMREWMDDEPLVIERAQGCWLIDTTGRRYLDGVASLWVNLHGHRHPRIDAAIRRQLDLVSHSTLLGLGNLPSIELAERLLAIAPAGLSRVFYSDSGSTAVEVALKMAFQFQTLRGRPEKREFVALAEGYHGDTIGAVSVGGIDLFHQIFRPLLFAAYHAPTPYWYRCKQAPTPEACRDLCLAALERILAEHGQSIAAFVLEPLVQGAAGMLLQPPGYLRQAAALCRQHDVLLICDEVATGFGRTGTMFACQQERVAPDLLCLAKGLSGGYLPLAATLCSQQIFDAFLGQHADRRTFFHGHSYTGNPLACAAALASLDIFEEEQVLAQLPTRVEHLRSRLAEQVEPLPHVGEIRQRGLMVGIELVKSRASREPYRFEEAVGARVCRDLRRRGVILRPLGAVVVLMPPLSVSIEQLDLLVDACAASIAEVTGP